MITAERHRTILQLIEQRKIIRIQELVDELNSSESTIRRDLSQLEQKNKLKRVHGGASILHQKKEEPSILEKSTKYLSEKVRIAKYAASLIKDNDCIFLDAGTTTNNMIPYINAKNITVVTNSPSHLKPLLEKEFHTYVLGGFVKPRTEALIGQMAVDTLRKFRFDKSFIGVNGIHLNYGYTTPDPEEATLKSVAMKMGQNVYVLADHTKFHEVTFTQIAELEDAVIITNEADEDTINDFKEKTSIEVIDK
ncbi:DeoR family transcriptional regulator [Virgibacillus profundi]|uniref:DeoR family transcriptional regulator n=1 Tax=Virgibacillus profundi TaxID=2024555 RepID=A0A2A2I7M4_9BACI|nr:DeoR/GlpR family DNA-binding transcription regulator [Virgibacillus profundi]PAV27657.1 DeoR family transcriptional regulator [Virgibacillus profundi]PXY51987.1 DeoR/GlpR transcriptional regulator [Virgibacillus profundi]